MVSRQAMLRQEQLRRGENPVEDYLKHLPVAKELEEIANHYRGVPAQDDRRGADAAHDASPLQALLPTVQKETQHSDSDSGSGSSYSTGSGSSSASD